MAKTTQYNPPPNWPVPPEGWTPTTDWQPDPAWGPPPEGWSLWVTERANPRAWGYAFASAGGLYVLFLVLALVVSAGRLGAQAAGELLFPFLLSGVVVGAIAWSRRSSWPVWLYPLVVLGLVIVIRAISVLGQ